MKRTLLTTFLCIGLLISCTENQEKQMKVRTEAGMIEGYIDNGILAFTNIPYCKADRFMPPQKPDKWEGVLECKTFPPQAMQFRRDGDYDPEKISEEGATRLNVWTKSTKGKKPVMVWLHGGGFASGAGYVNPNDSGRELAGQDVVFVSVNHRLNILGFLDLSAYGDKYKYSGNVGMMDIVAALEWVRDNISEFGGDPDNVTIFGESGGGGKVGTLLCMPSAVGLFHKAAILSGTLLNINTQEMTRAYAAATLKNLNLTDQDVDKLAEIPYQELVMAGDEAVRQISGQRKPGHRLSWGFAPTVDGEILVQQPFQPSYASFSRNIPLIMGTTFNELERTYYAQSPDLEEAKDILEKTYGDMTERYIDAFQMAYPEYNTPADMLSVDKTFRPSTVITLDARSGEDNVAPTYAYIFAWKSTARGGAAGSAHGFELPFIFHTTDVASHYLGEITPGVQRLSDKMSKAWVNFAYTGKPEVEGLEWSPYTQENGTTMYFNESCSILHDHDRELMTIMQDISGLRK